jgi:hypothetical protein
MYALSLHTEEINRSFDKAREVLFVEIMNALSRTAELASSYAKTSTLYKSHTYGLRSSIQWGTQLGAKSAHAVMRASAPYAAFVENGTKPHTITAKRQTTLRFVQNGAVRFSRSVRHPGTKPRPFMAQAQDRATPLLERLMGEAISRAFV